MRALIPFVLAGCATSLGGTAAVLRGEHGTRELLGVSGRIVIRDRDTHPTDDARYFAFGLQPFATHGSDTGFGGGVAAELGGGWHAGRAGGAIVSRFGYWFEDGQPHLMFGLQATFELEPGGSNWRLRDVEARTSGLCERDFDDFLHIPERATHHLIGVGPIVMYRGSSVENDPPSSEWLYGFAASYTQVHEPDCLGIGL